MENAQQLGLQTPDLQTPVEGKKRPSGCRISAIEVSR